MHHESRTDRETLAMSCNRTGRKHKAKTGLKKRRTTQVKLD